MAAETSAGDRLEEEPPTGSVVAIDWGESHQEVWVSNKANIGNWYTPDIPLRGDVHPVQGGGGNVIRMEGRHG